MREIERGREREREGERVRERAGDKERWMRFTGLTFERDLIMKEREREREREREIAQILWKFEPLTSGTETLDREDDQRER